MQDTRCALGSGDRTGGEGQDLGQTAGEHEVDDDSQCYRTDQNRDEGAESDLPGRRLH